MADILSDTIMLKAGPQSGLHACLLLRLAI
jgi:hypothetical protein